MARLSNSDAYTVESFPRVFIDDDGYFADHSIAGYGSANLKALTASATGTVTVAGAVTGGGSDTLRALTETATGITGALGSARDTLRALQSAATGTVSVAPRGFSLNTLRALTSFAGGNNDSFSIPGFQCGVFQPNVFQNNCPPVVTPSRGGGPAWWPGSSTAFRPWWYTDLEDKARELERLRNLRIELGILPAPEDRKITKTIEKAHTLIDKSETQTKPSESLIKIYEFRAEKLIDRIERLLAELEEEDDEEAAMIAAKYLYH